MEPHRPLGQLRPLLGLSLAAGTVLCLAGCGDSTRNVASYHPPTIQAATSPQVIPVAKKQSNPPAGTQSNTQPKAAPKIGSLPLTATRGRTAYLSLMRPDAVDRLAVQVRAAYAVGEQDAKATHNDAARQDYNRALDLLLASGFDVRKQPELSELFNQIMSSLSTLPGTAQDAEAAGPPEVLVEQQSKPSPLDEINAITSFGRRSSAPCRARLGCAPMRSANCRACSTISL